MKRQSTFKKNFDEICYNIVNSGLTGLLAGLIAKQGGLSLELSLLAASVAAVVRFSAYWKKEEGEYRCKKGVFCFI